MRAVLACVIVLVIACSPAGLSDADKDSLHNIELETFRAYSYTEAGTGRAFDRVAYCNAEAILRRNDAGAFGYDTKGAIQCAPPGKQ